jgi:hypothetical protein
VFCNEEDRSEFTPKKDMWLLLKGRACPPICVGCFIEHKGDLPLYGQVNQHELNMQERGQFPAETEEAGGVGVASGSTIEDAESDSA